MNDEVKFSLAFNEFYAALVAKLSASAKANFPTCPTNWPEFSLESGPKYVKIVRASGGSKSVYGFVDRSNGDILKAASYRKPAKHARGSIYAADHGLSCCNDYSIAYMR